MEDEEEYVFFMHRGDVGLQKMKEFVFCFANLAPPAIIDRNNVGWHFEAVPDGCESAHEVVNDPQDDEVEMSDDVGDKGGNEDGVWNESHGYGTAILVGQGSWVVRPLVIANSGKMQPMIFNYVWTTCEPRKVFFRRFLAQVEILEEDLGYTWAQLRGYVRARLRLNQMSNERRQWISVHVFVYAYFFYVYARDLEWIV